MNVYEVEIYHNTMTKYNRQFLAENWDEANKKAVNLLDISKKGAQISTQIEITRLELIYELSEV
jgi:hypothetical protein